MTNVSDTSWLVGIVDRSRRTLEVLSGDVSAAQASLLVVDGDTTCGYLEISAGDDLVERAIAATDTPVMERAWKNTDSSNIFASVVLCTVGKNPLLPRAVEAILAQTHTNFELIVVDNAPSTGAVPAALTGITDPRLRIVEQLRPGLSHARNKGVESSTGRYVAFTDDDAMVRPTWLVSMLDVFALAEATSLPVGAVTGPALPAELVHDSQRFFEARGGFPKTMVPTVWYTAGELGSLAQLGTPGEGGPLFPVTTARVGAGVSMAYDRTVLEQIGEFDTALGAGTATLGGEDLDAFARVLRAGYAIVTNPDAVVHHHHRPDLDGLHRQTYGDGTGMAALLTKSVITRPATVVTLASRVVRIAKRVSPNSERFAGSTPDVPSTLGKEEVRGFLRGPFLYARAVWDARRAR